MTGEDIARAFEKLNNLKDDELRHEWSTLSFQPLFDQYLAWVHDHRQMITEREVADSVRLLGAQDYRAFGTHTAYVIRLVEEVDQL
jgi:hypothetical protein